MVPQFWAAPVLGPLLSKTSVNHPERASCLTSDGKLTRYKAELSQYSSRASTEERSVKLFFLPQIDASMFAIKACHSHLLNRKERTPNDTNLSDARNLGGE